MKKEKQGPPKGLLCLGPPPSFPRTAVIDVHDNHGLASFKLHINSFVFIFPFY